jgi:hypothetical protein
MLTAPLRDTAVPLLTSKNDDDAALLVWTVHLLRGQANRLPRIALVSVSVLVCGSLIFHNILLAILPALALLFSLSDFLFPIRYTLTRHCARAQQGPMTWEIAWPDVRHAYLAADGVKLSPLTRSGSRLEPLRGVFLRYADNKAAVNSTVQQLRQEAANA